MPTRIIEGDMMSVLPTLHADYFDSVVCDPPYQLKSMTKRFGKPGSAPAAGSFGRLSAGFHGIDWDTDIAFKPETWTAVHRVMKPGAHLVAFGGSRTSHRMACAIEDAGFEYRELMVWAYGTGQSHSHDVERDLIKLGYPPVDTDPWKGWGTHLKPAIEPIILARKPLSERTVALNMLEWGTGALNLAECMTAEGGQLSGLVIDGPLECVGKAQRLFYVAKPSGAERGGMKHPTQKPLALMDLLVKLTTKHWGKLLDPFAGSGTTCLAADRLGINSVGIELQPEYAAMARLRLAEEQPLFA